MITILRCAAGGLLTTLLATSPIASSAGDDPPALDPFAPRESTRVGALPGCLELSNGNVHPGLLSLTRDARLRLFDETAQRFRDVPLTAVQRIDCAVKREWLEPEWRFKENANDQKVLTGRSYPAREYIHTITLADGRTLRGSLAAVVYVEEAEGRGREPSRFLLHQRDKGAVGSSLSALTYVRTVRLGKDALEEGRRKAERPGSRKAVPTPGRPGRGR